MRLGIRRKPTERPRAPRKPEPPMRFVTFERAMGPTWLALQLPVVVVSEANQREHWTKTARRAKDQRATVTNALGPAMWHCDKRYRIAFTRLWPGGRPLDDDNLRGAFKHVRDAVALWIGVDDGSKTLSWDYSQERAEGNGIRIRIEVMTSASADIRGGSQSDRSSLATDGKANTQAGPDPVKHEKFLNQHARVSRK